MTNFDLSTYIRWLKPGSSNPIAIAHESEILTELPTISSSTNTNYALTTDESSSFFSTIHPFTSSDHYLNSPQNQQVFETNISNKSSSSPTALGILLRSSIFRELVEKNSNISEEEETDRGDDHQLMNQPQVGSDNDEYGGMFYDEISDIPFVCSSNGESVELQERELHFIL